MIAVVVLIVLILLVSYLVGTQTPVVPPPPDAPKAGVITLTEPVPYCPAPTTDAMPARVQVLLDSSGSMMGVRPSVLGILRWLDQSVSRIRNSATNITELRLAQFDARRGILASPNFSALAADYQPSGRTTLHEAVAASRDYELTFIVTDGVAAAGSGSGSCAAGVDAACVARALRDAVHVEQTSTVAPQPGIWLVPLWVRHSGIFYTEKPVAVADFDNASSLQQVFGEVSQHVSISNARTDLEGDLVFDYTGPRGILLIVIAHSDDLGRRVIAALHERMQENGIAPIAAIREANTPLAAFPAMELYPGYVPPLEWTRFSESDQEISGTLDALMSGRTIAVECGPGVNEGDFTLEARRRAGPRCVDILQVPAFEFDFVAAAPADQPAVTSFISAWRHEMTSEKEMFHLTLQCGGGAERPCSSNPLAATWTAHSRYDRSHEANEKASGADALIHSIATTDPVTQPHRIFGLDSLVTIFFDEVQQDRRRIPLAGLELCHGRPVPK
ncbi:MAG TPA: hypothetical protein VJZ00_11980 [Thermoanaerobaculia bacterium]|nr:hypothetical protein [Thermoanaerobaculia bacterium]